MHAIVRAMQNLYKMNTSHNEHFLGGPNGVHLIEVLLYNVNDSIFSFYIEFMFKLNKLLLIQNNYLSFRFIIAHLDLLLLIQYYYC